MTIVEAKNVTKKYGNLKAVDDVTFDIFNGECFGFLGPNGAGKTTIMKMIYCYLPPTSGQIKVFSLDVKNKKSTIKAKIGVMPQEENLDPDLSVIENLIVYARYFNIVKRTSLLKAESLLEFVEMNGKKNAKITDLSGGMKRRLLLARAMINDPSLLILDEPTIGLDPHTRHSVWEKLNYLKSLGTTLILTTHYMEEAEKLCDRVAIVDTGKIVAIDTPKNLMETFGGSLEDVYLKLTGRPLES